MLLEMRVVIHRLVQTYYSFHRLVLKHLDEKTGLKTLLVTVPSARTAERKDETWHNPVDVSVPQLVQVEVLLKVKIGIIVPAQSDGAF